MGEEIAFRMTRATYRGLKGHFSKGKADHEQFAWVLCSKAERPGERIYLARVVLLPEPEDLSEQGWAGVAPSRDFQNAAYTLADEGGLTIFDLHTHTFQSQPRFSTIDDQESRQSAEFFQTHMGPNTTMGMLVFNRELSAFQGRVWDRANRNFVEIARVEILGRQIDFLYPDGSPPCETDAKFARHLLIPGWNQGKLEDLKVFLVGLGGNGANIFSGLLALGIGRGNGWIVACDPDTVEWSNLSRILFATAANVGAAKASVAEVYAHQKDPKAAVECLPCRLEEPQAVERLKTAHLIILALDRDWARKAANRLAVRYLIPILDVAAEVIPGERACEAGGQIRVVEPGATACLLCSGTLDSSESDPSALTPEEREARRRTGYIRGLEETPTPSVLDLNGVASHLALSHLRRMVFGEPLDHLEYVYYDRQACRLTTAAMPSPQPNCPVCGRLGEWGVGDALPPVEIGSRATPATMIHLENGQAVELDHPEGG